MKNHRTQHALITIALVLSYALAGCAADDRDSGLINAETSALERTAAPSAAPPPSGTVNPGTATTEPPPPSEIDINWSCSNGSGGTNRGTCSIGLFTAKACVNDIKANCPTHKVSIEW